MRTVLLMLALAAGCGADPSEALVVVQETNVPDELRPEPCEGYAHHYLVEYSSECGQGDQEVDVCADEALCEAQLEAIVEPLASCAEQHGYEVAIPDAC